MSHYLDPPSLLRVPDAQGASSSPNSVSSAPSFNFEHHSGGSPFTDATSLITPLDSVDSIFGNDPHLRPHPRLSDLNAWEGLTDEQWKMHVLVSKAEYAIKEAEQGVLEDLGESSVQEDIWSHDDLYDQTDEEFDAVAAVRARLMRSKPTITTQRALEIIERRSRSGPASDWGNEESNRSMKVVVVDVVEEIEDYAGDYELEDEVLEIPVTPRSSGIEAFGHGNSALDTIDEADEGSAFQNGDIFPATPVIRPIDADWDCPSFSTSDTSISTTNSVSQLIMSPFSLDNATTSSPAIFREPFDPAFGSPIVSVSSFLFRSRRPLATSLLDESLDIAAVMQLEIAARLRNPVYHDVTPRAGSDFAWDQQLGPGLPDVSAPEAECEGKAWTGQDSSSSEPFAVESKDCRADSVEEAPLGNVSMNSVNVEVGSPFNSRSPGSVYSERVPPFEPARSPWDTFLQGLGGMRSSTSSTEALVGLGLDALSSHGSLSFTKLESLESFPSQDQKNTGASSHRFPDLHGAFTHSSMAATNSAGLCETIKPYIPRAPPITLAYTPLGSNIDTIATSVTAGSNHPAASAEYYNSAVVLRESNQVPPKVKGLGLRLPSGLTRSFVRHSSCLPRSQGCHDLASIASSANDRPRRFRRPKLSPIPEVVSPHPFPTSSSNHAGPPRCLGLLPTYGGSPKGGLTPSLTIQKHIGFFRRTLNFLF